MGLKIKGIECIDLGSTRLLLNREGKIADHRDYLDLVDPTCRPAPLIGGFVRWLYGCFVA